MENYEIHFKVPTPYNVKTKEILNANFIQTENHGRTLRIITQFGKTYIFNMEHILYVESFEGD